MQKVWIPVPSRMLTATKTKIRICGLSLTQRAEGIDFMTKAVPQGLPFVVNEGLWTVNSGESTSKNRS